MTVCLECRMVDSPCNHEHLLAPRNWRPPKKTNDKAWKRVQNGEWLWDRNAIVRKLSKVKAERLNRYEARQEPRLTKRLHFRKLEGKESNIVDDAVSRWHDSDRLLSLHCPLRVYLGMSWEEYKYFVQDSMVPNWWSADKIKTYTTYQEYLDENRRPN